MTRILLVAPGSLWSTYDVYRGYLDVMHASPEVEVQGFNFHNTMIYHLTAMTELFPHYTVDDRNSVVTVRSARELLIDTILYKPDVVFFISGSAIPSEIYAELLNVRSEINRQFAVALYLTESPYQDSYQVLYTKYADVLFINDKYSVKDFDPTGTHYVEYLPHSFNPKVHRPGNENDLDEEVYVSDVFFGATAFRERFDMIASIDWSNVDLKLVGTWKEWQDLPEYQKIEKYIHSQSLTMSNLEYAKYYRNTKIALNVHRTRADIEGLNEELNNYTDAYSVGPRIFEAAACGAFIITDYRKEAEDIFGDTVEFFDGAQDLENKVHYWLDPAHEQERLNKAAAARERIKNCTFENRLEENILPVLHEVLKLRRIKDE